MIDEHKNEKREIEEYLKFYCIEECLDEIMNEIVTDRPTNPYIAISLLFESKTLPEIIDVDFKSVLVGGEIAVQATIITNVSVFTGIASYAHKNVSEPSMLKDYTMLRQKIKDVVIDIDPTNVLKLDESIAKLSGVDPAESLALSIACCRAGARHKGKKLYQFIANLFGLKEEQMVIPTPVVSVLSRTLENDAHTQDITLTVVNAISFDNAIDKLLHVSSLIKTMDGLLKPLVISPWGSLCVNGSNFVSSAKTLHNLLADNELLHNLKQGAHLRSERLLKPPSDPNNATFISAYHLDGPSMSARSGTDAVEILNTLWQETDMITLESAVTDNDFTALQLLQKRVNEAIYDMKADGNRTNNSNNIENVLDGDKQPLVLQYCLQGIGGDSSCHVQVPLDALAFLAVSNMEQYQQHLPFNCVKLQLSKFSCVSKAIEAVKKAQLVRWPVLVASSDIPTCKETPDTFIADLAVGIGAGQILAGGLFTTETTAKYNRIAEIAAESPNIRFAAGQFRVEE